MSLIAAAQWTAVATIALAAFAIVTAVFAFLAFRKQTAEVDLQRKEFERAAEDRRRAQASRVFMWQERHSDSRLGQAQTLRAPSPASESLSM
jgi:ABC-type anion transport system duplicated permease subunit